MKKQFIDELIEAESYALMLDLRDEMEDLLLDGLSLEEISNAVSQDYIITKATHTKTLVSSIIQKLKIFFMA